MKMYAVVIQKQALKQLAKLPTAVQAVLRPALRSLEANPRPPGCKKLQGRDGQWRIRRGDYRIIYEIEDAVLRVLVIEIGKRDSVYE